MASFYLTVFYRPLGSMRISCLFLVTLVIAICCDSVLGRAGISFGSLTR